MSERDLQAEFERLKAENERLKAQQTSRVSLKVSQKGACSRFMWAHTQRSRVQLSPR